MILFREHVDMEIVQGECSHSFPVHIHESLCVGMITVGQAEIFVNGCKKMLKAGDHYVIPPYTPHSLSPVGNRKFGYEVICLKDTLSQVRFEGSVSFAKEYIENATSEFSIDALSKATHISKYHLTRVFKEKVGITPYQFYNKVRVSNVRQGLQAGLPLSDIVLNLGFYDQSHLSNTFKKHIGITPMQYALSYQRC
jgi:AraC-like DNA-binding protein